MHTDTSDPKLGHIQAQIQRVPLVGNSTICFQKPGDVWKGCLSEVHANKVVVLWKEKLYLFTCATVGGYVYGKPGNMARVNIRNLLHIHD